MERKTFPAFLVKVDEAQGVVEHIVAVTGNLDLGDDIIHAGAFAKSLVERGGKVRCLDQHNTDSIMRVLGKPLAMKEVGRDDLPAEIRERTELVLAGNFARVATVAEALAALDGPPQAV